MTTCIPRVDGLLTDPRGLGRHTINDHIYKSTNDKDQMWMCSMEISCNVILTCLFPTGPP